MAGSYFASAVTIQSANPVVVLNSGQMDGLTGLRAVAAAWVVAFHYSTEQFSPLGLQHDLPILHFGYLGVDLFFMLSGFVIWHVHAKDFLEPSVLKLKRFVLLRLARLYPVYLFTLLLLGAMFLLSTRISGWTFNPAQSQPRQFAADLTMLQTWGLNRSLSWNYPSWSVSAEWFCYFLFPLAAVSLVRLRRFRAALAAGALLLALAGIYLFVFGQSMNQALGWAALVRALIEFLLGCLLRQFEGTVDIGRIPLTPLFLVLLAAGRLAFAVRSPMAAFMPVLVFPVLILAASTRETLIGRLASWPPLVAVGAASYSLYLMQAPVQTAMKPFQDYVSLAAPGLSVLIVLAYIGVLAAGTVLVYRCVERPCRRVLRRRIGKPMPA